MRILHISAECYPAAKAGGLGDVVGALPKYQKDAAVVIPKYHTKWIQSQSFEEVFRGHVRIHQGSVSFTIQKLLSVTLGFDLYVVDIPTKYDRPGVYLDINGYGFGDEIERSLSFQQAVLQWVQKFDQKPAVLHCHDHHTGLVPFLINHCPEFESLKNTPTVFTIHNGEYHGAFSWQKLFLLPYFKSEARGILDWKNTINPLAAAIKCAWKVTTVSPNYMKELTQSANGLEWLLRGEYSKSQGILNGIDNQVWDPKKDPLLSVHLKKSIPKFKEANKKILQDRFDIAKGLPIFTFIGRLAREKGADLLPEMINHFLANGRKAAFIILGTGNKNLMNRLERMKHHYRPYVDVALEYNEGLAHQLYAGSDFILMPSRVEPCGLNQLYAMRYGSVPIVRKIGGLADTVPDIGGEDGYGFNFTHFSKEDAALALFRAADFHNDQKSFKALQKKIMSLDFSWEKSAETYENLYSEIIR